MKTLFVASAGGHLAELVRLEPRLRGIPDEGTWVTFDTPQSRSLLENRDVVFVRHTYPRDVAGVVRNLATARRLLGRATEYSAVVSNGSGIALSFLPPHGVLFFFLCLGGSRTAPMWQPDVAPWKSLRRAARPDEVVRGPPASRAIAAPC